MMMMTDSDSIPFQQVYKNIGIHCDQPPARVKVVKRDIDRVLKLADPEQLARIAADVSVAPEARLLAAARVEAAFDQATEDREARPNVNLDKVRASVAGLDSLWWRCPTHYGTDAENLDRAVRRERRLPDPDYSKPPKSTNQVDR